MCWRLGRIFWVWVLVRREGCFLAGEQHEQRLRGLLGDVSACVVGRLVRDPAGESSGRVGRTLETKALNTQAGGGSGGCKRGHDKSDPCATAVVVLRRGETEAGRPGRRPGSCGAWRGGHRGCFLVKRAWLGP